MSRMVRDVLQVRECSSIDALIEQLSRVRKKLPDPAQAMVRMRGDDVFGRLISVSYWRPQTPEEAECDERYGILEG
jgi:hypothetical protein